MQHPKTRVGTTGTAGKLKTSIANRENVSSRNLTTRSPKAVDHRLQRTPATEKKRVGRVSELETQVAELKEELKKTKERLNESESRNQRIQQEAEDAKKQLAVVLVKLDESQQNLDEIWACEESRIQELRKISQERDRAWESELKAVQKHHAMDSAALAAAINENQKLKIQLHKMMESKTSQAKHADEVLNLRLELSETLDLVDELKTQLNESKDSEARALELISEKEEQETVNSSVEKDVEEERRVEELASTLAANVELESELRRLKVQTEQWRKAAEMAAAMVLGDGDNNGGGGGKFVDHTDSFDFRVLGEKTNSSYSEDTEDESSNKKTNNMLKKIGVFLKKSQK